MATEDLSRSAFDPRKHYSSVRMQQGRVIVDDDWNENERIENEARRRSLVDIIGPVGSPDQGFNITPRNGQQELDFTIATGTFYLGGLRLELEDDQIYRLQKDWLQGPGQDVTIPTSERTDLVYLQAYQEPVSAVEDRELLEAALGGPDTSARLRTMQRVHVLPDVRELDCAQAWQELNDRFQKKGSIENFELRPDTTLRVSFKTNGAPEDLCSPSVQGGYLGAENQAIRVQLVDQAHLTWGFDNAAPLYRITVLSDRNKVTMDTQPKDSVHRPTAGQAVEILPWAAELPNKEKIAEFQGHLTKVASSDPNSGELTLETPVPKGEYHFMRVWFRGSDTKSLAAIEFTPGSEVVLEHTGLAVTLTGSQFNPGDYWIIAVRPGTPDEVVPWEFKTGRPPHGVRRFYAPLALIHWTKQDNSNTFKADVHDCRPTFRPLTRQKTCCTYTVGDGKSSFGDFDSLEDALKNLPDAGGRICLLPGLHAANVTIRSRHNIVVAGCGEQTIMQPKTTDGTPPQPIFKIQGSQDIRLETMALDASAGTAIEVVDPSDVQKPSQGISILQNRIIAAIHAIEIRVKESSEDNGIRIIDNQIAMLDKKQGRASIFSNADGVLIERNRIVVIPANDPANPFPLPVQTAQILDPCAKPGSHYGSVNFTRSLVAEVVSVMQNLSMLLLMVRVTYKAQSGIQLAGGSERVVIRDNEIIGGCGHGITLGDLQLEPIAPSSKGLFFVDAKTSDDNWTELQTTMIPFLYQLAIEGNTIQNMGLAGIGVAGYFSLSNVMFHVQDLTIYRNRIVKCLQQVPATIPDGMIWEVGFGGIALASCEDAVIQENRIEDNGVSHLDPVCGIWIRYGEKIDISNNRILNNGPRFSGNDNGAKLGWRGGVVITNALKTEPSHWGTKDEDKPPCRDGIAAVKIHGNAVTQPLGQALFIVALGPVSVVGNCLTSQGSDFKANPFSVLAGTVLILDLGVSKDLAAALLLGSFQNLMRPQDLSLQQTQPAITAVGWLMSPSGEVIFANNQVTMDLRTLEFDSIFCSVLIASLDDVSLNGNQLECASWIDPRGAIDAVAANTVILSVTSRVSDNRFQEGITQSMYSLFSNAIMNTATSNQATHCLHVLGAGQFMVKDNNMVLLNSGCRREEMAINAAIGR